MTLRADLCPDAELPDEPRRMIRAVRRAGFGCRYAGRAGHDEVYVVRDPHRGGSLVIDRTAGRLELWSPVDPNGSPARWGRVDPARADLTGACVDLLVDTWGRPADHRAAVRLRAAEPADARGIAEVHVRAWQHAYRGILPDDLLDSQDPVTRAVGWRQRLALPRVERESVVAEDADDILGFTVTCPSRDPDADGGVGELAAIYVDPGSSRIGIGRRLMSDAVDRLRDAGWTSATLWVLAANAPAIAFYERMGWEPDGATKQDTFGGRSVIETRYRRALG